MAHKLLRDLDEEYREKRAELIADNNNDIVRDIHEYFQHKIINLFLKLDVKEIVKFDYMTNLEIDGDKHIWVNFIGKNNSLNYFKIIINHKTKNYCILNEKKYLLEDINITIEIIEDFSELCLSEFRRGYDKP